MQRIVVFLSLACIALASHGRFGSIKFTKLASDPQTITFTFDVAFRRSYFGSPVVGTTINDGSAWTYGDGTTASPNMLVTEINTVDDWLVAQWTVTKRYSAAGNYQVGWASCCRIFALNNNPSYSYAHYAYVILTTQEIAKSVSVNQSPVSSMLPIIEVPYGFNNFQYNIRATDPENGVLRYSMASATQQGDSRSTHPTALSVNSATGLVTIGALLATGYWSTQQVVTDPFGNWITIDYMLNVQPRQTYCNGQCVGVPNPKCVNDADCSTCNTTCIEALPRIITNDISSGLTPATNLPSPQNLQTFNRNVGQQVIVNFVADDANLKNPATGVQIYSSATPAGSVFGNQVLCSQANGCTCVGCNGLPQLRTLTWTPTSSDLGSNTICVGVKSLANYLPYSQHCITINVIALPITSGALTTQPLTTKPLTTQPVTSQPLTTKDITTQPLTTKDITTEHLTTESLTTKDITTQELTTQELTTQELTTQELTTQELTTQELTTQELTTQELTTQELTTQELTTQPLTTQPLTTQPLTTSFATVAARCATYGMVETQGYYCAADGSGYYQCLKGPWAPLSAFRPCAPGTSCKCPVGIDCASTGLCTNGPWAGPY